MLDKLFNIFVIGYVWFEFNFLVVGKNMFFFICSFVVKGYMVIFVIVVIDSVYKVDLIVLGVNCEMVVLNCSSFN